MKRKICLSIAFVLGIGPAALTGSDSTRASRLYRFDTGVVALGQNQALRVTVAGASDESFNLRISRSVYGQSACTNGACRYLVQGNQIGTDRIESEEAVSIDLVLPPDSSAGRIVIETGNPQARVTAQTRRPNDDVIDTIVTLKAR